MVLEWLTMVLEMKALKSVIRCALLNK